LGKPANKHGPNKLVRRSYWMDMPDQALVVVMTKGIGANLTKTKKEHT
jgi:hypothetical protein